MAVDNKIIYKEIKKINENLETLVAIYKNVLDSIVPSAKPTRAEDAAIKRKDEIISKDEFLKVLEE